MVDLQKQLDTVLSEVPRCIHLTGVDGTGKTTQGRALLALLHSYGIQARYTWLRFPRLYSVPFLVYARLRGFSHREVVDGHEHGYWNFEGSWLMSHVFPYVLWLDALLLAFFKVYIPLWRGSTVLCDRFVIDMLVDLMVGLNARRLDEQMIGRLFLRLLPSDSCVVVLDLETNIAQQRSPELVGDHAHAQRRQTYLNVAARQGFPVISTEMPVERITSQLVKVVTSSSQREQPQEQKTQAEMLADKQATQQVQVDYPHITGNDRR